MINRIILVFVWMGIEVSAGTYVLQDRPASVEFLAVGRPSAIKIRGKSTSPKPLSGSLSFEKNTLSGAVDFSLNQLSTDIDLRDQHMKEKYLEVAKFPNAQIVLSPTSVEMDRELPFTGQLTLHGVSAQISGTLEAKRENGKINFHFFFPVDSGQFKIETPEFMGIRVGNRVEVTVDLSLDS